MIVLDPGDVHDGRSGAHGGYAYRMLYIDADSARGIVADVFGRPGRDFISDSPLVHDPLLAREINAAWGARAAFPDSLESDERLHRIITRLARHGVQPRATGTALQPGALRRVREYLHDRIGDPVATIDLARVAGLSRFQLTRQFRRAFGLPLHAYHLQIRLEEARRRLQHGQTVASVAADLGFVDQSHLHRRFRARFGVTPGEWRRTAIQDT